MTEMAGAAAAAHVLTEGVSPAERVEDAEANRECANCGARLVGPYCHRCGQHGHLHTRIWHMAEDFVEGVLHFDGRLWRTLPLLAFKPGRLSRAWIEGKRVRYVAPLHIFLFGIFLFFFSLNLTGGALFTPMFEGIAKSGQGATIKVTGEEQNCTSGARKGMAGDICAALDHIRENPKYYAYKAESTSYKLAPLLAPISMVILALLLVFKRGYTFYDHGVVALYGLSFLVLITTLAMLLNTVLPGDWPLVVLPAAVLHAVLHLRGAYHLSWFGSVARTLLLGLLTSIVFTFFLFGVAAMSAA